MRKNMNTNPQNPNMMRKKTKTYLIFRKLHDDKRNQKHHANESELLHE
jgi:hypothetical protein